MSQSETIAKLATALSKAQGQLVSAKKDSSNPYFKSKYADLESVWEACREAMSANELAVIQAPQFKDGQLCLETTLIHSSGEWIRSTMPLMLTKNDPQTMGSAITYGRRYALASMVGIVQSDDDGEKAMEGSRKGNGAIKIEDITLDEVKKTILNNMKVPSDAMLGEYLDHCKKHVTKPMKEVLDGWLKDSSKFLGHYAKWLANKKVADKSPGEDDGETAPSVFKKHA